MRKIYYALLAALAFGKIDAQVLNQNANWPNPAWTITGSYSTDPLAFEFNPTTTANFAFDDDDATNGHEDNIAAESPVINLTPAFNALERSIRVNVMYGFNRYTAGEILRFEYWNADTSAWIPWGGAPPENGDTVYDNFCTITKTLFTTPVLDISTFTPTQLSGFKYRIFYDDNPTGTGWNFGFCFDSPVISSVPLTVPDYVNLQFPFTASTPYGGPDVTIYAQVYEAGLTDVAPNIVGQAPGIQAWIGYSTTNTNPNTWTNWIPATWNSAHVSNNDEYQISLGAALPPGTYYYASRFSLTTGPYRYGGANNFWDATTAPSGVLTVTPLVANDICSGAVALTPGGVFADYPVDGTLLQASTGTQVPSCQASSFSDVWYSVVVPASGSLTLESQVAATNTITDGIISVYTGTCGGTLTQIGCNDDGGPAGPNDLMSLLPLTGLTPASTIYVMVSKYGSAPTATVNAFRISAYDASLMAPTFDASTFAVYPNPVKDVLHISNNYVVEKVQVINLLGQEVLSKTMNDIQADINMSGLTPGPYLVTITSNEQTKTLKVIKQ